MFFNITLFFYFLIKKDHEISWFALFLSIATCKKLGIYLIFILEFITYHLLISPMKTGIIKLSNENHCQTSHVIIHNYLTYIINAHEDYLRITPIIYFLLNNKNIKRRSILTHKTIPTCDFSRIEIQISPAKLSISEGIKWSKTRNVKLFCYGQFVHFVFLEKSIDNNKTIIDQLFNIIFELYDTGILLFKDPALKYEESISSLKIRIHSIDSRFYFDSNQILRPIIEPCNTVINNCSKSVGGFRVAKKNFKTRTWVSILDYRENLRSDGSLRSRRRSAVALTIGKDNTFFYINLNGFNTKNLSVKLLDFTPNVLLSIILPLLSIRLSQVTNPNMLQFNRDFTPVLSQQFLVLLNTAGWIDPTLYRARRFRSYQDLTQKNTCEGA